VPEFELSFGGLGFRHPTPDVLALIERLYPLESGREFMVPDPAGIAANTQYGERPIPADPPAPTLFSLFYPRGAVRWATFRGLMSEADKNAVLSQATAGEGNDPLPFVMDDGTGLVGADSSGAVANLSRLQTDLYLLPPRPVLGIDRVADLWLVTLVDERYYWRWRHTDTTGMTWPMTVGGSGSGSGSGGGTLSWEPLFAQLADDLGIDLDYTTWPIAAAYLSPSPDSPLYGARIQSAYALEQAAASVGRVVCRRYDGSYVLVPHQFAVSKADAARRSARRSVGGILWPGSGSGAGAGGTDGPTNPPEAIAAAVPVTVEVTFPEWVKETGTTGHYHDPVGSPQGSSNDWPKANKVYSFDAADLGPPYDTWPTTSGVAVVSTTCKAEYGTDPPTGSPLNDSELQTAALAIALDYYDECSANLDEAYNGVIAFDPLGGCDITVRWPDATRARRQPLNRHAVFSWLGRDAYRIHPPTADCQRVDPGEPRADGVPPPVPQFASWQNLLADPAAVTLTPIDPVWFWDLNSPAGP
jgi:hypothetical protein